MRSRALHFAHHRDFLRDSRHEQSIAVLQHDVLLGARLCVHGALEVDHQPADRRGVAQACEQRIADRQRLGGVLAGFLRGHQRELHDVRLHAGGERLQLVLLAGLQLVAREHRTVDESHIRQAAGARDHRAQRLTAVNRIDAGESHLAAHLDLLLLGPQRHFLDHQVVEGPERDVGRGITRQRRAQIDLDEGRRGARRRRRLRSASIRPGHRTQPRLGCRPPAADPARACRAQAGTCRAA